MFVYVKLLSGFPKTLVYKVPFELQQRDLTNTCILVPLKKKKVAALVIEQLPTLKQRSTFEIREIIGLKPFPTDPLFHPFVEKAAALYFTTPLHFYQKLRHFLKKRHQPIQEPTSFLEVIPTSPTLTEEQKAAAGYISQTIAQPTFAPIVLDGVTGSGKTEVYKEAIRNAIQQSKSVLFLLPEVALALQFTERLRIELPEIEVHSFHSGTQPEDKKRVWHLLLKNRPTLIIGVHLPVLLPIPNLGLIIVDEEHEPGFEEKKHPKLNSKYLALLRASLYQIPIVLGSATPSIQTIYNAQKKKWSFFKLTKRFGGAFPSIETIILPDQPKRRASFWVSKQLQEAIETCLSKKQQAIIFLNRRGYGFFVQCKECGFVIGCPACSVSLTAHQAATGTFTLRCHYCNYARSMPQACEGCKAPPAQFLTKGIGTQQLVEILQKIFPAARIARADLDITSKKNMWVATAAAFERGEIDILVGTKSVTKGYHFPGVTLVGVIWGDLHAHIPVFNAAEHCLQQLIQVAGRAGREHPESRVIIQTMYDHEMFKFINEIDYLTFAEQELATRQETWYPPFCRLAQIELKHKNTAQVDKDAQRVATLLRQKAAESAIPPFTVLGPAIPAIHKVQNIEVRHIFIKTSYFSVIEQISIALKSLDLKSSLFLTLL